MKKKSKGTKRGMYTDYPFDEVCKAADKLVGEGHDVYQKFTCSLCGSRQGMQTPNVFHISGKCELCGTITDIRAQGCNYMLVTNARRV